MLPLSDNSLPSSAMLKSRKDIGTIFREGKSVFAFPFKVFFRYKPTDIEANDCLQIKAGFSVPKKKFKKSVDRNLLRRKAKEAYREVVRVDIKLKMGISLELMFVYCSFNLEDFYSIKTSVSKCLQQIQTKA